MKQETIRIEKTIVQEQQGSYLTVPFRVKQGIERIDVDLAVQDANKHVIDLGLKDSKEVRGWSGGARRSIFVREDRATPGYDIGAIEPGEWEVLLNAYKVTESCKLTLTVTLHAEHERWFKGDLHVHTNHSDGQYSVCEVMQEALRQELDFIALTDHNTFSQNMNIDHTIDLAVIPAVELTTNKGHSNFYGVNKAFRDFRCETAEDVQNVIREGGRNGAFVSVNHPHCDYCPWEWGLELFNFESIEIWNGKWKQANQRTLAWWQEQLEACRYMIAIGGSDKHHPHQPFKHGEPTTVVKAARADSNGVLDGIKEGKVIVLSHPKAPVALLSIENKEVGEVYEAEGGKRENLVLQCKISHEGSDLLRIYSSRGLVEEISIESEMRLITRNVSVQETFYRVELWKQEQSTGAYTPLCITNPVYIHNSNR